MLQPLWESLIQTYDETVLLTIGSWLVAFLSYFAVGIPLLLVDLTHKPTFLYATKMQPQHALQPSQLSKLFKVLATNFFFVMLPYTFVILLFCKTFPMLGGLVVNKTFPALSTVIFQLIVVVLFQEVLLYYSHRMLHLPKYYGRIHKIHHEWTAPIGLSAIYCHPIEMLVSNVIPSSLPAHILRLDLSTFWIWTVIAMTFTQLHHCGYAYPKLLASFIPAFAADPQPRFHDLHHELFNVNYGLLAVLDQACGTADKGMESRHKEAEAASTIVGKTLVRAEQAAVAVVRPFALLVARLLGLEDKAKTNQL